ncbi:hypothetical protein ES703_30621 [subsurface metagenome]
MAQQGATIPRIRVVDDDGRETVGELDVGLVNMVVSLGQLGQMAKVRKALERTQYQGKIISKTIPVTDQGVDLHLLEVDPYMPWATASFVNKGPDSVKVAINRQRPFHTLDKGDSIPADFTNADTRIEFIEAITDPGETASVRCLCKY